MISWLTVIKMLDPVICYKTLLDPIFAEYEGSNEYWMDMIWYHLNQIRCLTENSFSFNLLYDAASIVLMIPCSNAGLERVFFQDQEKQKWIVWPKFLDGDKTLSFILAAKLDRPGAMSKCYKFKLEKELLHKAKKATMEYNQESSSKQDWNLIPLMYFLFFCNICLSLFIVYCLDVFFEIDVDRK